jgi:target of rapamycin complex 2 subunit MAPKAP1
MGKKKKQVPDNNSLNVNPSLAPGTSATTSPLGISPAFGSLMSTHGPQMFLRIRVAETADAVHISTTIPV